MRVSNVGSEDDKPGAALNNHVLRTISRCVHLRHLKQLQAHLVVLGHGQTQFFCFKLVRFCTNTLSHLPYARAIFDSLPSPNIFLYTAMLSAYSHSSPSSGAHLFIILLRRSRPRPNQFIFPPALRSFASSSTLPSISAVHSLISKSGFHRDGVVQTSLLDAYARSSDIAAARRLFDELPQKNTISRTAMITGLSQVGMVAEATVVFEEMPERDVPSWNSIIAGYTQNGFFSDGLALFRRMIAASVPPNETTLVCAFSACAHLGTLQSGKSLHGYAYRNSIADSRFVSNALLDVYGKCGSLHHARHLFDEMRNKSVTHWNSIINCLALHGRSSEALARFQEMEKAGAAPDEVTFVGLLNACVHGGQVDEGRRLFGAMAANYGLAPRIEHYGCFVDLLGRAGKLEEAMEVVEGMEMAPDEVVWGAVLNGCRVHGKMKMAETAVRKLLELDPMNAGYAVLLANLYSWSGRWEEMGSVRKEMKEKGGRKLPGCSWIELEGQLHQFYSGDRRNPLVVEIVELLEVLLELHSTVQ
ncbi:pentatricopeptide repeat-containing protein At1g33350-like [Wolffia australiana]